MVKLLKSSRQPVELRKIAGPHYQPMPADRPAGVWKWFKKKALKRAPKTAAKAKPKSESF